MLAAVINDNNGPNGHLFYVGGDLMMKLGMLPIIMLPDGDFVLRCISCRFEFWLSKGVFTLRKPW